MDISDFLVSGLFTLSLSDFTSYDCAKILARLRLDLLDLTGFGVIDLMVDTMCLEIIDPAPSCLFKISVFKNKTDILSTYIRL